MTAADIPHDSGGHCGHCSWSCRRGKLFQAYDHSSTDWKHGGEWDTDHRPACAERARIVAWLRISADPEWQAIAGSIEHGEHLEQP